MALFKGKKVCKDCPECRESTATTFIRAPKRMAISAVTSWNVGLFRKKCPHCGHLMRIHDGYKHIDQVKE